MDCISRGTSVNCCIHSFTSFLSHHGSKPICFQCIRNEVISYKLQVAFHQSLSWALENVRAMCFKVTWYMSCRYDAKTRPPLPISPINSEITGIKMGFYQNKKSTMYNAQILIWPPDYKQMVSKKNRNHHFLMERILNSKCNLFTYIVYLCQNINV